MEVAGAKYDCGSRCTINHPFNKGRRKTCERIRKCSCGCGDLQGISLGLHDACVKECNQDLEGQLTGEEWLCANYDPAFIYNAYNGATVCGFRPLIDDPKIQLLNEANATTERRSKQENNIIIGVLLVAALAVVGFALK